MRAPAIAAVLLMAAYGCGDCRRAPEGADAWPALPRSNEDARRIFAGTGKRPTTEGDAALASEATTAWVRERVTGTSVAAGWEAIDAELARWVAGEKDVVVAFGTSHDSPAQIDAFRRLVGPRSSIAWTGVMLEQLYADGRWRDVDAATQAGDDAALDRYAKSGARADIAAIVRRVERDTYTAWKYGSVDVIGDLVAEARAAGRPVSGCDMAPAVRARLTALDEGWVHRTREVHCALAMRDRAKREVGVARIAALWGRTHVHADAFPRLAPADWSAFSVSVLDAPDDPNLVLVDPIFVHATLVLPSTDAAKRFERKRTKARGAAPVSSFASAAKTAPDAGGPVAWIDGRPFERGRSNVAPGRHLLAVEKSGTLIAASIDVPQNGAVEVLVAEDAPEVTATIVEP